MEENNQNQLIKLDNSKILDVVSKMETLSETEKRELTLRILSDDLEIRRVALGKITESRQAYDDFMNIMGQIAELKKTGMYIKTKQMIKTGSGTFEIESKGGDTKLIIPVLVIVGIVIIAVVIILFWHR